MSKADKQLFSPIPLRAMAMSLSGLQWSALTCVCAHDRMSLVTGKGQGCRASNERMSTMIGCHYSRLCSTLTSLVELGLLKRESLGRHSIYRAIYDERDTLLFRNLSLVPIGCQTVGSEGVTGCQHTSETKENPPKPPSQYIPLNGGIHSVETGEENSSEEARFAARRLGKEDFAENVGGQLARLERAISVGGAVNRLAWMSYLDVAVADEDPNNSQRAIRLSERLIEQMDAAEYEQWGQEHGLV